jgi:hypothetical protein
MRGMAVTSDDFVLVHSIVILNFHTGSHFIALRRFDIERETGTLDGKKTIANWDPQILLRSILYRMHHLYLRDPVLFRMTSEPADRVPVKSANITRMLMDDSILENRMKLLTNQP